MKNIATISADPTRANPPGAIKAGWFCATKCSLDGENRSVKSNLSRDSDALNGRNAAYPQFFLQEQTGRTEILVSRS